MNAVKMMLDLLHSEEFNGLATVRYSEFGVSFHIGDDDVKIKPRRVRKAIWAYICQTLEAEGYGMWEMRGEEGEVDFFITPFGYLGTRFRHRYEVSVTKVAEF